jgi:hypothetical protein
MARPSGGFDSGRLVRNAPGGPEIVLRPTLRYPGARGKMTIRLSLLVLLLFAALPAAAQAPQEGWIADART